MSNTRTGEVVVRHVPGKNELHVAVDAGPDHHIWVIGETESGLRLSWRLADQDARRFALTLMTRVWAEPPERTRASFNSEAIAAAAETIAKEYNDANVATRTAIAEWLGALMPALFSAPIVCLHARDCLHGRDHDD